MFIIEDVVDDCVGLECIILKGSVDILFTHLHTREWQTIRNTFQCNIFLS